MPPTMPAAPPGGFPQTPPIEAGIITASIDDTLVTPSAHMVNVIIGREISRNFAIEGGYIGRFGRDLLIRRDLAMPLNLVDTRSGKDYFTAAQEMIRATQAAGIPGGSAATGVRLPRHYAVLGEPVPGAARSAGSSATRQFRAPLQSTTGQTTLRLSGVWIKPAAPGVQHLRSVRVLLPSSTIRSRRSAPSAGRTTTR